MSSGLQLVAGLSSDAGVAGHRVSGKGWATLGLVPLLAVLFAMGGCSSVPLRSQGTEGQAPVNGEGGCHAPPPNTRAAYNRTYRVLGRSYTPLASASGYEAQGQASWYGWESGSTTSMGDRFNPRAFTAASRTLPLPTCVQVTNLANGRSALVLVNDRGPFVDSRIMDLSYGAAQALGITRTGTAQVRIVALAGNRPPAPAQGAPAAPVSTVAPQMDAAAQPETFAPAPIAVAQAGAVNAPGIESRPLPPLPGANSGSEASPSETLAGTPAAAPAALAASAAANATAGASTASAAVTSTMAAASSSRLAPQPAPLSTPAPTPQTLAPQLPGAPQAYLQTGAFALQANAEAERAQLQAAGIGPVLVVPGILHGAVVYRVQIGPLPGHAPDTALLHKLRLLGLNAYAVVQQ
ncbi:MAG: septal ring lytic transglycosylase RlpA family protein [Burkholderiales bacterium]|nr:septal ring lytic transglycosylase RlpA family protein [Burkholderiales bacterium]